VKVLVTGGGGFVGSHVVERFAKKGHEVLAIDSFARTATLGDHFLGPAVARYNWEHIANLPGVTRLEVDVRDSEAIDKATRNAEAIVHTAAQVAVTTSIRDPKTDFDINVVGTANVLEGARKSGLSPAVIFCSTNKVYGDHVNQIPVRAQPTRYEFDDPGFAQGIPESIEVDNCHHSPYGVSKLAADLYVQEYARSYGLPTAVFRMSCIYGTRQFGMEDQGWVAHFALSAIAGRPLTIYGDGKQVRDVLFVDDLVNAYEAYLSRSRQLGGRVFNIGGGTDFTLSLLELLSLLESRLNRRIAVSYSDWRPADQRVYISDIRRVREELGWSPRVTPKEGIQRLVGWAQADLLTKG
jgi:CDP-paratose 2-epimerase